MSKKCIGCGSIIQHEDKNKIGYAPIPKSGEAKYCERCFKITHYNEKLILPLENINKYIIDVVNKNSKYVFFMIDLLNINEETINTFKNINVPKTLIISKLDIIPKSIKETLIEEWLKDTYNINNDIKFLSTKKNINTRLIVKTLEELNINSAHILGFTNAGKSTLINKICEQNNIEGKTITTSILPNTTVDFINIPITENITIIDSPGFTSKYTLYDNTEYDLMKNILPRNIINPITEQTKENTSLIIENKIRINANSKNSFTFYMSNAIKIDKVFEKNTDLTNEELIKYNIKDNTDIVIKGLGFINIKKACNLTINTKYKELIEIRESMFK
ncbi:MAG: GTPase RsgA [Candidatus Coprovivens sp.]